MKKSTLLTLIFLSCSLLFIACKKEENEAKPEPSLTLSPTEILFSEVPEGLPSELREVSVSAENIERSVNFVISSGFELSDDSENFRSSISFRPEALNEQDIKLFIRAVGGTPGLQTGMLTASSPELTEISVSLQAEVTERSSFVISPQSLRFDDTPLGAYSAAKTVSVVGEDLTENVLFELTEGFEISEDGETFSQSLSLEAAKLSGEALELFIRHFGMNEGEMTGTLTASSSEVSGASVSLSGSATLQDITVRAFDETHLAFGDGFSQASEQGFVFPDNPTHTESVKMFVRLDCPSRGCNAWDVFAHVQVKDPESGEWYEMGRYITPYGIDNRKLDRGFEIDVTDFRSLLKGEAELRAYIEVWGSDGWLISVDFDFIAGEPEFPYSSVSRVIQYNRNSLEGVPYGVTVSEDFDLTKSISLPAEAESAHLRTIITGWGHATPTDTDGRPCAEWCYRTHEVLIDGTAAFSHEMSPIGCGSNPVSPQAGNWRPDRAGWCPGMSVPVRYDEISNPAGRSFSFEYDFQDWVSDGGNTSGQNGAYYAISTFVVAESKTPLEKSEVIE